MKKLITILGLLIGFFSQAQVETIINVPYTSNSTPTYQALLYLPNDYGTTGTQKYPLLIFSHGSGENHPPLSNIYNSTTAGGPPYLIEHGQWPVGGFFNPKTGATEKFIVVSPQAANTGWSMSGDQLDNMITYLVANYRVDPNRIHGTGLSSGGGGMIELACHLDGNESSANQPRNFKMASMVPMSPATNSPQLFWIQRAVADSIPAWLHGDQINDTYGEWALNEYNFYIGIKPGYARLTGNPGTNGQNTYTQGHGGWNIYYNPNYRETFTWNGVNYNYNMYEWMLTNVRNSAPVTTPTANAGSPQSITLPTNNVTLSGSGTAGSGHTISSYGWTKTSGPTCTITTPNAATTTVTGMTTAGTYVFLLTVTNEISATATSSVTITVNAATATANAGSNQTITLPTNSVNLNGSASTGSITSYLWTQISGPNTANITASTSVIATASSLVVGTYVFRLSVNGGASTSNTTVNVQQVQPCGNHIKYTLLPDPSDSGVFIGPSQAATYKGGDTLLLLGARWYNYITLVDYKGNSSCPLVIINDSAAGPTGVPVTIHNHYGSTPTEITGIKLDGCVGVKITGTGDNRLQQGIVLERDPQKRFQGAGALVIAGRSANVEATNIYMHNVDIGIVCESNESCDSTRNYPNWIIDSIHIHDVKIVGCWNEGMYIGNTSPDNASFDLRPVTCPIGVGGADSTIYPAPMKNGWMRILNNYVDSTGRSGIQVANAIFTSNVSEVAYNIVKHAGLNHDDAQGVGIDPGLYSTIYIHDNNISNTYTWGIASLGAGATNIPVRIENNTIDSSGFLNGYNLATTNRLFYDPRTEPVLAADLTWPYAIFVDTKTRLYTDQTPHPGTAIRGQDSTMFWIKNNLIGLFKGATRPDAGSKAAIQIQDDVPGIQKQGNIICNNTNFNGTNATIFTDNTNGVINYVNNCGTPPVVNSSGNQSITLPTSSTSVTSTSTATSPATITSVHWSQISGPNTATITTPNTNNTSIIGLIQGTYVFAISVTDSNGLTTSSNLTIVVNPNTTPPGGPCTNCIPIHKYRKLKFK